jgi:imidazolonepropionase-like amidohydrolase
MRHLIWLIPLACVSTLFAQPAAPPSNEPLALTNANVVNVRDGRIMPNTTIALRNGRIESIGSPPASGMKTVDLKGRFVLPGLIDAHTHASDFAAFRRALESGVTTVRSAGV